jgi:anti-sigma regulatory factor (Ser/Thr protein kinase)
VSTGTAPGVSVGRRATIGSGGPVGPIGGTIRWRVARILALPGVVVLALLGVVTVGQLQDHRDSQATAQKVQLTLAVQNLVHELQTERGITAGVLGGNPSFRNELTPARQLVDQQRTRVQSLGTSRGVAEERIRSALQQLDGLAAVRSATDSATASRQTAFAYYTDRIAALSVVDLGMDRSSDDELRRGASALQALQDLSEALAQERALLNGVFSAGGFSKGEFVQFATMRATKESALARFMRLATPTEKAAADFVFATGAGRITGYFERVAADAADGRHIIVNPQSWWSGLTTVLDDLRQLQQHVGSVIQVRAHDLQQASGQRIAGLLVIVLLTVAGSVYVAALASRSITRPLAALAAEANSVATERLPAAVSQVQAHGSEATPPEPPARVQIPVLATSEIRSVAAALDRLQTTAHDLAIDQALQRRNTIESLANLGRRNQNLIRRQLGFITALEHDEIDPSALANLFELDHLATRMRRNAASLLVLVGASSPRQWSSAVPVADAIRAAVSEVEEYRRVVLRRVDEALVIGTAVGSISHLLSELIENGLTFSPPDTEVEIQGRRLVDGYLIAVTDQGVGMGPEDLRQANAKLRGEEDFIAAPARFLGHFVVGQLCRETGTRVELLPSPVAGITARVTLPRSLLTSSPAAEVPDGSRHSTSLPDSPAQLAPVRQSGVISLVPPPEDVKPEPRSIEARPAEAGQAAAGPAAAGQAGHPTGSGLPAALTRMLGQHPLIHTFAGDLTVTAPNEGHRPRLPSTPAAGPPATAGPPAAAGPPTTTAGPPTTTAGPPTTTAGRDAPAGGTCPPAPPASGSPPQVARHGSTSATSATSPGGGVPEAPVGTARSRGGTHLVGGGDEATRTRNGLRKRLPRDQRPSASADTQPVPRAIPPTAAPRPAVADSPAEVRVRLTALRAGMQRGQAAGTVNPVRAAGTDHVVEDSE